MEMVSDDPRPAMEQVIDDLDGVEDHLHQVRQELRGHYLVKVPYEGEDLELVLDPSSKGRSIAEGMNRVAMLEAHELEIVFRGTTILYAAGAGTFGECLDTSIIWVRG